MGAGAGAMGGGANGGAAWGAGPSPEGGGGTDIGGAGGGGAITGAEGGGAMRAATAGAAGGGGIGAAERAAIGGAAAGAFAGGAIELPSEVPPAGGSWGRRCDGNGTRWSLWWCERRHRSGLTTPYRVRQGRRRNGGGRCWYCRGRRCCCSAGLINSKYEVTDVNLVRVLYDERARNFSAVDIGAIGALKINNDELPILKNDSGMSF